jgi:hypothetical protein
MAAHGTVTHQTVRLARGKHTTADRGACVMEVASMLAGEPFSDRPQSVCPVVASVLRAYNDAAGDDERQDLLRFASDAIGTRGPRRLERARLERCLRMLNSLGERRRPFGFLRRAEATLPSTDSELERMSARLVRALRRRPDGHTRALLLIDALIAMRDPDGPPPPPRFWVPSPPVPQPIS